jgi:hypothetical protein
MAPARSSLDLVQEANTERLADRGLLFILVVLSQIAGNWNCCVTFSDIPIPQPPLIYHAEAGFGGKTISFKVGPANYAYHNVACHLVAG